MYKYVNTKKNTENSMYILSLLQCNLFNFSIEFEIAFSPHFRELLQSSIFSHTGCASRDATFTNPDPQFSSLD